MVFFRFLECFLLGFLRCLVTFSGSLTVFDGVWIGLYLAGERGPLLKRPNDLSGLMGNPFKTQRAKLGV